MIQPHAYPTNPSFIRRVVKGLGHAHVRVSPSTGDVFVKDAAGRWVSFGTTRSVLDGALAAHRDRFGKDAAKLFAKELSHEG